MTRKYLTLLRVLAFAIVLSQVSVLFAQTPESQPSSPAARVPKLITLGGNLVDGSGKPMSGVVGLRFALYKDQFDGTPLWTEVQNAELNEKGGYTVMLGAYSSGGVPAELFNSDEKRWMGVQPVTPGEQERPRYLIVSVPYALKAADADTLGGLPVSAFALANKGKERETSPAILGLSIANDQNAPQVSNAFTDTGGVFTITEGPSALYFADGAAANEGTVMILRNNDAPYQWSFRVYDNGTFNFQDDNAGVNRLRLDTTGNLILTSGNLRVDQGTFQLAKGPSTFLFLDGAAPTEGTVMLMNNSDAPRQWSLRLFDNGTLNFVDDSAGAERLKLDTAGNVIAPAFVGNGSSLTNVNASLLGGQPASAFGDITGVTAGVGLTGGSTTGAATLNLSDPNRTRGITYLAGCDTCTALLDTDDQKTIYFNVVGSMSVVSVTCFADAGTPTINILRDDGTPANILTSNLTCNGTPTTSFTGAESTLALNDKLDFALVSAGGAKRVTVAIKTLVN